MPLPSVPSDVRPSSLDISEPMGGEWFPARAEALSRPFSLSPFRRRQTTRPRSERAVSGEHCSEITPQLHGVWKLSPCGGVARAGQGSVRGLHRDRCARHRFRRGSPLHRAYRRRRRLRAPLALLSQRAHSRRRRLNVSPDSSRPLTVSASAPPRVVLPPPTSRWRPPSRVSLSLISKP